MFKFIQIFIMVIYNNYISSRLVKVEMASIASWLNEYSKASLNIFINIKKIYINVNGFIHLKYYIIYICIINGILQFLKIGKAF